MKILVDLSFSIPIWRFFYSGDDNYIIPYEFIYHDKKYTNSISIIQFGWNITEFSFNDENFLNEKKFNQNIRNVIVCVPTIEILNLLRKYRPTLRSTLANHNAFIDERIYKIDYTIEKKFNMVVNSAFSRYKNYNLLKKIDNTCCIGYYTGETSEIDIPNDNKYCPNFEDRKRNKENFKWIDPYKSVKYYNMSKIGGIFSINEGACFSSSEYLLCGLPVLSCKCSGGREIWYDDNNCVLCDPNEDSIITNLNIILERYDNGYYNREIIRENHIKIMEIHRDNLTNAILDLFKLITRDIPSFQELKNNIKYYHSNSRDPNISESYKHQYNRELQALEIL